MGLICSWPEAAVAQIPLFLPSWGLPQHSGLVSRVQVRLLL